MLHDADNTLTSRARLMLAGKTLFAKHGFEQTSTAAISREAGTSESQLVRYFEGKAGLLQAIFNESWKPLNQRVEALLAGGHRGKETILGVLSLLIEAFARDPDAAFLFLFEGRRIRGGAREVNLSEGFVKFAELVRHLIRSGQESGALRDHFSDAALASALMGAAEGMIRDRIVQLRAGHEPAFTENEVRRIFTLLLEPL